MTLRYPSFIESDDAHMRDENVERTPDRNSMHDDNYIG